MGQCQPGGVSTERNASNEPVVDGALVVGEQKWWEIIDQERDVPRGPGCDGTTPRSARWSTTWLRP